MSLVLSVRLTEVQDISGSEAYSESTVKLCSWFDCSPFLLLTVELTDVSEWWICSLAADSPPPVHQMSHSGFCFRQFCVSLCVCVWCLHIEFQGPLNYPCHRNPFNSSDLNFTCMTALIGYWKQHTDLISLSSLWPSQLSPRCALICFLGGGDCATISFHK